jgi:predicted nucleic acid-binding protein
MECVIDTNVLIYEAIEDSEFHDKTDRLLDKITRRIIPTVVLEEFIYAIAGLGISNNKIGEKIAELTGSAAIDIIPISVSNIENAVGLVSKNNLSFRSFNDQLILSIAKAEKLPLFTFDTKLISVCTNEGVESIKI